MASKIGRCEKIEIGLARQPASQAADRVFHTAFLPWAMWITEEGLDTEGRVKPMVLSELVPIVEADGLAHRSRQFAELAGDGSSGGDGLSIGRTMNQAEAALSFVENHQPLAGSGEHHKVGLPMARRLAAVDLNGTFCDRAPLFDEACGAAAPPPAPSHFLVTWQQTIPVILLGRAMIDETID